MVLPTCENASSKAVNDLSLPWSIIGPKDDFTYTFAFSKILSISTKKRNIFLKMKFFYSFLMIYHLFCIIADPFFKTAPL